MYFTSGVSLLSQLLPLLGGHVEHGVDVCFSGRQDALPSSYAVGPFASASIASALVALRELSVVRNAETPRAIFVDELEAAAAFRSERALTGVGFSLPVAWDPLAGDYATSDGFIRLHTNYAHHAAAMLRALGVVGERAAVAQALARLRSEQVETAVVGEGGAAAALRTEAEWAVHPQGRAIGQEPLAARTLVSCSPLSLAPAELPLTGIRVLDFTRVIAGPVCTRVLAAYGASVLRVDPPAFDEVFALMGDTTWGKRRTFLDLKTQLGRDTLNRLLGEAHMVVVGYRSAALEALGLSPDMLAQNYPSLICAWLNAYGHTGPWRERRGFDSLVQMSCGMAARGMEVAATIRPVPLPAQALDHGTGYLLASALIFALRQRLVDGKVSHLMLSLARTAVLLSSVGNAHPVTDTVIGDAEARSYTHRVATAFGPMLRLPTPGRIAGVSQREGPQAGPLGCDAPQFEPLA